MPYFITDKAESCNGWATIKGDGEVLGCHTTKQAAINQMVALSIAEGMDPGGQRADAPAPAGDQIKGSDTNEPGSAAGTGGGIEQRAVSVPEYMRNAAARGLELRREGFGGDGLTDKTVREARLMADGQMSDDKVVRTNAWAARHAVDLDAPKNRDSKHPDWPGAGAVAHYLWGIDPLNPNPARRWLERQVEKMTEERQLPDNYRPALEADVPEGRACGNCMFYDETNVRGDQAFCERWDEYVDGGYYCNAWQPNNERTAVGDLEFRTFDATVTEIRAMENGDGMTFGGYAWRYGQPSLPLPFTERIAPGAFTRSLKSRVDIRAYVNHNDEMLLGSTRAKTLRIDDRAEGGYVEIDLPNTTAGNDVRVLTQRGDISGMSFGFATVRDKWSDDGAERTLMEAKLFEVSVVTGIPAYPQTTASVRNLARLAARTATDVDDLAAAMTALQLGTIDEVQATLLRSVVDQVSPQVVAEATTPMSVLAAKLQLAEKALGL